MVNTLEPEMVREAIKLPHWKSTMQVKYDAMMKNDTWKLVDLPPVKKAIGCKWMFKTKYKANGALDKHKSSIVAKGYAQQEEIEYEETFSAITKME